MMGNVIHRYLKNHLDERSRRLWGATEANVLGHGGVKLVAKATGMAESTIRIGRRQLRSNQSEESGERRVRQSGGGRKRLTTKAPHLLHALDALVEPTSRGDPTSPLRWTCKSTRKLEAQLKLQGFQLSHTKVGQLLKGLGYRLQSPRKRYEGVSHPDCNAQFEYINSLVKAFQGWGQPVISVDTKKKELIGNFAHGGREYRPTGTPEDVEAYDFPSLAEGKGIPYGVYDMTTNHGWVSVGTTHDTAQFAVETIRQWVV
jgi:transposase